jgi:lysophospholipase-3
MDSANLTFLITLSGIVAAMSIVSHYFLDPETTEEKKEKKERKGIEMTENKIENFENLPQGSKSGMGFQHSINTYPLFLNFYPAELGQDFNLSAVIRKLKMIQNEPTLYNGMQRQLGSTNIGAKKCPIILVPGIGASTIYGKWNKNSSKSVKKLDAYGNFTTDEKWACRDQQNKWVPLWFPDETTGLNQTCWSDNTRVQLFGDNVVNSQGVQTTTNGMDSLEFQTGVYSTLIEAFQALGHVNGTTLFGASYDFRTICTIEELAKFAVSLTNLIESSVNFNNKKAVLVCHGLGAVLMNFLLVNSSKEWKDKYIQCFIMISASFGGSPKALRVLLSGEKLPNDSERVIIQETVKNFTGLQWMLPRPEIFKNEPIVYYRQNRYTADKMPDILKLIGEDETSKIYTSIINGISEKSLEAPNVLTYVIGGVNVPTEYNFYYEDMNFEPVRNYPQDMQSSVKFNGDGTMPRFALEYPLQWTKFQKEPVHFRFYEGAEHSKILSMLEPVTDILEIIRIFDN